MKAQKVPTDTYNLDLTAHEVLLLRAIIGLISGSENQTYCNRAITELYNIDELPFVRQEYQDNSNQITNYLNLYAKLDDLTSVVEEDFKRCNKPKVKTVWFALYRSSQSGETHITPQFHSEREMRSYLLPDTPLKVYKEEVPN